MASALAAGTLVLAPGVASASSSQTWTGGGDGSSWGDAKNWASQTVPQNGDSVTIPAVNFPARTAVTGVPSGFNPHGKSFSVLLYHSRSGKFTTLSGSPAYTVSYGTTAAKAVYP